MKFAGFGHITLTVSNYDACLKFYDRLMAHIGMRRYFESPLGVGWFADEYMFVMGHAAPAGDRFSQWRTGLHHLSFRARSRAEVDSCYAMLKEIGAKIIFPAEPGPFMARLLFGGLRRSRRHPPRNELHSARRLGCGIGLGRRNCEPQISIMTGYFNYEHRRPNGGE